MDTEKAAKRQELNTFLCNETIVDRPVPKDDDDVVSVRRSERERIPTEKMLLYSKEEQNKREKKLCSLYEQWKVSARTTRQELKCEITGKRNGALVDELAKGKADVLKMFDELRSHYAPDPEIRRKVDACVAVTGDLTQMLNDRLVFEYDAECVGQRVRELREPEYARSVYGSVSEISCLSKHSSVAEKRAEAAADLAAKEAEYESLIEKEQQEKKMREVEEECRKEAAKMEQMKAKKPGEPDSKCMTEK